GAEGVGGAGAAVERVRDDPLPLVGARIVFVENRMRRDDRRLAPLAVDGHHQNVTGRAFSPLRVRLWRCSGSASTSASRGSRRTSVSIAICPSTRASGAPRQK